MKAVLSALLALALSAAGCTSARLGLASGRVLQGDAVMAEEGEGWRALEEGALLQPGVRLRTGLASARLELEHGELWMGRSATVRVLRDAVELERGEVVLHAEGAALRWENVEVSGEGVYRLSPGASPRIGVYEGRATVRRPGETRRVPALRQLGLGARRLPAEAEPLYYAVDDEWDRELLPRAIAFDEEVSRLARGIDREYGVQPQPATFYDSFTAVSPETVPVLAATARQVDPSGAFGPPSDALVTLFVSAAIAKAGGLGIEDAVRRVARQRAVGARWGLIAMESDVAVQDLATAVDLARERRQEVAPRDVRPTGARPTTRPSSPRGGGGESSPRPTQPPSSAPTPRPSEPPPGPGPGTLQDTIEDILRP